MTILNIILSICVAVPLVLAFLMILVDATAVDTVMPIVFLAVCIICGVFSVFHVAGFLALATVVLAWPTAFGLLLAWHRLRERMAA